MLRRIILNVMVLPAVLAATVGIAFAQSNIDNTAPNKNAWARTSAGPTGAVRPLPARARWSVRLS